MLPDVIVPDSLFSFYEDGGNTMSPGVPAGIGRPLTSNAVAQALLLFLKILCQANSVSTAFSFLTSSTEFMTISFIVLSPCLGPVPSYCPDMWETGALYPGHAHYSCGQFGN